MGLYFIQLNETSVQMWNFMESQRPSVFVNDYNEGIERVRGGSYAFLMESSMLDYVVQVKSVANSVTWQMLRCFIMI